MVILFIPLVFMFVGKGLFVVGTLVGITSKAYPGAFFLISVIISLLYGTKTYLSGK